MADHRSEPPGANGITIGNTISIMTGLAGARDKYYYLKQSGFYQSSEKDH